MANVVKSELVEDLLKCKMLRQAQHDIGYLKRSLLWRDDSHFTLVFYSTRFILENG